MKRQKYFVIAALFLLIAGSVAFVLVGNENTAQAARQTVETYCKVEFEGAWVEDRWAILKFSDSRKQENSYREITDSAVFGLQPPYPFIVIASYDIREVRVLSPTRASAHVTYRRLAHSESATGRKWRLIAEPAHDETVTLNLTFDKKKWWALRGQWWILDPPPPRISKQVLLEYYKGKIKHLGVEDHPKWQRERDIVKLLNSL